MGMIVSADEHMIEPAEFWDSWLPEGLPAAERGRAPRLDGGALVVDGYVQPVFLLFPELTAYSDAQPGVSDVEGRLAVMDREGIHASLLFPQRAMGMFAIKDPALRKRCFTLYNEFMADFCARSNGRLHAVAVLPTVYEPEATAEYLAHVRSLGFRIVQMPGYLRGTAYGKPEMEPVWAAIEKSGLIAAFHTSETADDNGPGGLGTFLAQTQQPFRRLWAHLVFSGVLERHPGLRVLFAEGGISWVPSALDHADRIQRDFAQYLEPKLPRAPSEYWFRQCYATFMDDPRGIEQIDYIGADRIMWSSDYPHPEGTRGRTQALIAGLRDALGPERAEAVLGGNAAAMLGLV